MMGRKKEQELIAELGDAEEELLRNHRIRLRVDKVTPDGRSALCSAAQVHNRFLRSEYSPEAGVRVCHHALLSMHRIGLSPLIGWIPRDIEIEFSDIAPNDPFSLRKALLAAGKEELLPRILQE